MADPPPFPGRPRWVKAALLIAALVVVLLVLLMVLGEGRHGPGRHLSGGAADHRAGGSGSATAPAERRS